MARIDIKGMDEYALKLSKLAKGVDKISEKAVMAGADPVADAIRANLESNLSGSDLSTGSLLDSLGIAPPDRDNKGDMNTKIGFDGYDENTKPTAKYPRGTPQAVKARAMESGTSYQKKRPFIRPAVRKTKKKSQEIMARVIDEEIEKLMK